MSFSIADVIELCRKKNVSVCLRNPSVGLLIIESSGISCRGSAETPPGTRLPPMQPDEVIAEKAHIFTVRPSEGEPFELNREEFEKYLREENTP